jgi:hypothetical protein
MPYADKEKANECRRRMLKRRKDELVALLGGCCEKCGSKENLTIEHKEGRDYSISKLSSNMRLKKYKEEFLAGVKLAIRCLPCNSADGNYWSQFYAEQQQDKIHVPMLPPPPEEPFDEDSRA